MNHQPKAGKAIRDQLARTEAIIKTESSKSQREKAREQVLADPNRGQLAKKQRQYLKLNQAEASNQKHRGSF